MLISPLASAFLLATALQPRWGAPRAAEPRCGLARQPGTCSESPHTQDAALVNSVLHLSSQPLHVSLGARAVLHRRAISLPCSSSMATRVAQLTKAGSCSAPGATLPCSSFLAAPRLTVLHPPYCSPRCPWADQSSPKLSSATTQLSDPSVATSAQIRTFCTYPSFHKIFFCHKESLLRAQNNSHNSFLSFLPCIATLKKSQQGPTQSKEKKKTLNFINK